MKANRSQLTKTSNRHWAIDLLTDDPLTLGLTGLTEQLIQNQLFDQGVRGILQITQRKQQSGSTH
jgi:hypothetical protein